MTPSPALPTDQDHGDLLAAEYALGLLSGEELTYAEELLKTAPDFAAQVTEWQSRLAPLADEVPAIPPPNLLPHISARLFGPSERPTWRQRATLWLRGGLGGLLRGLLGTGALAAVSALVMALLLQWGGAGGEWPMVQTTTLTQSGSAVQFLARLDGDQLTLTRIHGPAPATGRAYEVWIIPKGGNAQSLGLIVHKITLPAPLDMGYALAITDEPFGGAPNGVATGPVIAVGMFAEN